MTEPQMDWEDVYRQDTAPPWSIGAPQPELAALIEQGKVRSEVLDAGCGHAELSLALAAQGYRVVGLDASQTAIAAATAAATERGLTSATFAQADITDFGGYDGRFNTVMDSGCLHTLPVERRQGYVEAIHRAAAPGAALFILAFAERPFGHDGPGPNGFTADELRDTLATRWTVDEVRSATLYGKDFQPPDGADPPRNVKRSADGLLMMPGFLLSAHKDAEPSR
ncbi:class I SAM-dependent methyltransferase [Mycolicibacterium pulveris]|uniref:class I SAM-dependent methyltransferase n=1 Tax=Mycolicibacterium pulveris TaxID=36813 RepID=UPI003CF869FC